MRSADGGEILQQQEKIIKGVNAVKTVVDPIPESTGSYLQLLGWIVRSGWATVVGVVGQIIDGLKVMVQGAEQVQKPTMLNEQKLNRAGGID